MERNYETIILMYYLIVNIILFFLIFIDKKKAIKHKWRIKEKTLFTLFLLGGFIGGFLSMKLFRHKTKKPKFYFIGILSFILNLIILFIVYR